MAALKAYDYDLYREQEPLEQNNVSKSSKKIANKAGKSKSFALERLKITVMTLLLVGAAVFGCSHILNRYVTIHTYQHEIFTQKQLYKDLQKQRDELIVKRESFMSLAELEDYAVNYLGMVKADESRKVIIAKESTYANGLPVSMQTMPNFTREMKVLDSYSALGALIKKVMSF
jgi:hypothetical protein